MGATTSIRGLQRIETDLLCVHFSDGSCISVCTAPKESRAEEWGQVLLHEPGAGALVGHAMLCWPGGSEFCCVAMLMRNGSGCQHGG